MTKTFYITYWANKHKKHILQDEAKHDDKSRYGTCKTMVFLIMFIMI